MSFFSKIVSSVSDVGGGKAVVGIDIGSSSLKVVELQEKRGVITLSTYGELQLGPYADKPIGESTHLEANKEQEALVDIIRESAVEARSAVFAMPLSASFVTNVTVGLEEKSDIAAMVRVEARKVIPASLSEVTLDWAEVGSSNGTKTESGKETRDILIAAIQNSALDRYKLLMQFVGLGQPPTEIECFSVLRGLHDSEESNVAILDVGATSSKLYLMKDGLLVRMYRIRAGGVIVTREISEKLHIDFEKAEELKCNLSKQDNEYADVRKIHQASYDRALREFNQVINDYEEKTGLTIEKMYLTGGGSQFVGFEHYVREELEREVHMANPFAKVAYPAFMEDVMSVIGPSFTVALGAAMRSFE